MVGWLTYHRDRWLSAWPVMVLLVVLTACAPITPVPSEDVAESEIAESKIVETEAAEEDAESSESPSPSPISAVVITDTVEADATPSLAVEPAVEFPEFEQSDAYVEAGLAEYRSQYCGVCHELTVVGTRGTFGPKHDQVASEAAKWLADERYTGAATTVAEYLYESIVDPYRFIVPGYEASSHRMPPFAHLDEEQLKALVAMLLTQE